MKMNALLVRLNLTVLFACSLSPVRADKIDDYVKDQMAKQHIPGLSVAVIKEGKIETARGYGFANLEHSVPATANTIYEIGSITKQFTATAVMLLVEDGKVGLDAKIPTYLDNLPDAWKDVTVRHLMTHTSGIHSYTNVGDFIQLSRTTYTKEAILKLVADKPLDFPSGTKWSYSNTGYFLLGLIVEKTSGKSYGDFLTERIFTPLGMSITRNSDPATVIPNRSSGYVWANNAYRNVDPMNPTAAFSAGFLVSSVTDMAKWDAALYGTKLLKQSSLDQMWTAAKTADGKFTSYGFGWGISTHNKHRLIGHGGGTAAFLTTINRFVDDKLTVIVLTNCRNSNPDKISKDIAAMYVPELTPTPLEGVADKDPKITEMLKSVLLDAMKGEAKLENFTPATGQVIAPRIKEGKDRFASFGALKSFKPIEQANEDGIRKYKYQVVFESQTIVMTAIITPEGKIAGLNLMPQ